MRESERQSIRKRKKEEEREWEGRKEEGNKKVEVWKGMWIKTVRREL